MRSFFKSPVKLHQDFQGRAARSDFALPMAVYVMAFFFPLSTTVKRITGRFKKEYKDNLTKTLWYYNKFTLTWKFVY